MVEVRNTEIEYRRLRVRLVVALLFVLACFTILGARFWFLQIHRHADFLAQAEDNRISLVPSPPARGTIVDRRGIVLAENVSAYTLEIAPNHVPDLEATIEALSTIVDISNRDKRRFRRLRADWKHYDTIPLKTRLTEDEVARLAAQRFMFPGVEIKARQFRTYPLGETATHVLGYIGRLSPADVRRIEENGQSANYAGTTHIGKIGVELSYESVLHGQAGADEVEVSAGGRIVRRLSRQPPVPGSNLVLSIDVTMQRLIETWFGEERGALVAIEPSTGEILSFVSMPTYDPNLFVDGIDVASWQALNEDPDIPLLNRPLRGTYPPGSTYKPFMALAILEENIRTPAETMWDPGYFKLGRHRFRDSHAGGRGWVDMRKAIVLSSDTYFYKAAYDMGVDAIHDYMVPWGFGQLTGIDLANESRGILPSSDWKMRRFKQRWLPGETPSVGIGQGYNAFTILQLAHATATLANGGLSISPRLVREVEDAQTGERRLVEPADTHRIPIDPANLELVHESMVEVNITGTGRIAFRGAEYVAAGKTGTSQVIGIRQNEKYDEEAIERRHRDHSLYMVFAPAENPKIALAVIMENAGFGAAAAAPLARKVLDYHLLGKLPPDTDPTVLLTPLEEAEIDDTPPEPVLDEDELPPTPLPGAIAPKRPPPTPSVPEREPVGPVGAGGNAMRGHS
ncbi:MAG: penicillin-binding protein 2 [Burkholderiaceae bacterium]